MTLSPQAKEYYENLRENLNMLNRFAQESSTQNSKAKALTASDADVSDEENPAEKEKSQDVAGVQSLIDNFINTLQNTSQRQEDARSLKEALRELKSLLALIKSKMREEEKASGNERNDIAAVEQNLNDSGNIISQMALTPGF